MSQRPAWWGWSSLLFLAAVVLFVLYAFADPHRIDPRVSLGVGLAALAAAHIVP